MEKVSIIVLTYNQEDTIRRTLDSILGQRTSYTYCIYIGDDGSKDSTRSICEEYAKRSNVKLMPQAPNKGVVRNYFDVLKICNGEYIMCCAGDDWWHNPNKIQLQVEYMDNHPECSLCHSSYLEYYPSSNKTIFKPGAKCIDPTYALMFSNFLSAPTVCYRRKYVTDDLADTFVDRQYLVEDYPLWLALSLEGNFYTIEEPLVSYTVQRGSIFHCNTFEERMAIQDSAHQIRIDFIKDNNLCEKYEGVVQDVYNILSTRDAILYDKRELAISYLGKVRQLDWKWFVKKVLIHCPFTFKVLHKYYSRNVNV